MSKHWQHSGDTINSQQMEYTHGAINALNVKEPAMATMYWLSLAVNPLRAGCKKLAVMIHVLVDQEKFKQCRETRLIRVAVGIVKREDKILVAQRPIDKPYSGYWEFPGGKIEADETGDQALKRELLEELGIAVTEAVPLFEHEHAYPDKTVLLEMWLVTQFDGEPTGKENQSLKWATLAEMLTLRLLEGNSVLEKIKIIL